MKKVLFLIALFIPLPAKAQVSQDVSRIINTEKILSDAFGKLFAMEDSPARDSLNNFILVQFSEALQTWDGFYYRWNSLQNIGKVYVDDEKVRIFTWHLLGEQGKPKYYGLLAFREGKLKKKQKSTKFRVWQLEDHSNGIEDPENQQLSPENWLGALYYRIKTFTYRKKTWYALFGYDLNDQLSNKKSIDILSFQNHGEPVFGGQINTGDQDVKRLIFEYSEQVVMSVKYDEKLQMIVWDHLTPFEPIFRGNFKFYGPDGSYDGLRFEKGEFIVEEDVDARNY